jgi:hypothetical protein
MAAATIIKNPGVSSSPVRATSHDGNERRQPTDHPECDMLKPKATTVQRTWRGAASTWSGL